MTQTPEGKALELVEMFMKVDSRLHGTLMFSGDAKQCAIICVDEMIGVSLPASDYGESTDKPYTTEYLQKVRTAIENL
jgi:hypothetical protein